MLNFEAALAQSQADLGLIPEHAAAAITAACSTEIDDAHGLLSEGWHAGTPLAPMLTVIRRRLPDTLHRYLHYGATSQDALDTATMLQIRRAFYHLFAELLPLVDRLHSLADEHRHTPAMARTLLQHAQPTSFGWTVSRWLSPLIAAGRALQAALGSLPVQLGGAVGALSAFPDQGTALVRQLASRLSLQAPAIPWHSDRTPVLRPLQVLTELALALRKASGDLVLLAQGDVAEVRMRAGVSSAMPHKQNPIDATRALAAAEACLHACAALYTGRAHELERAVGGWQLEWLYVPLAFNTSAAALVATKAAFVSLTVENTRLRETAGSTEVPASTQALIDRVLADARDFRDQPSKPTHAP